VRNLSDQPQPYIRSPPRRMNIVASSPAIPRCIPDSHGCKIDKRFHSLGACFCVVHHKPELPLSMALHNLHNCRSSSRWSPTSGTRTQPQRRPWATTRKNKSNSRESALGGMLTCGAWVDAVETRKPKLVRRTSDRLDIKRLSGYVREEQRRKQKRQRKRAIARKKIRCVPIELC